MSGPGTAPADNRFAVTYPLAFLGAHLAFMPFLLLLLPRQVERFAPDSATATLSLLLIIGAVTASLAYVAAGHWSDRWLKRAGSRRLPVLAGLVCLTLSYAGLAAADTLAGLVVAVIAFQVALNLMFAPLGALLADYVADARKGLVAAWLALALPASIALSGPLVSLFPADAPGAFGIVMALVALCVIPLLLFWPNTPVIPAQAPAVTGGEAERPPIADFTRAWLARFLIQCGAALVLFYLYLYLRQIGPAGSPQPAERALAILVTAGGLAGALAAVLLGRWSDRLERRRWPAALSAAAAAAGLFLLAVKPGFDLILGGYALFSAGLTAFLALDSALIAQMLGNSAARGRWLGIMNLTNTLPAIVTPTLTLLALQVASTGAITALLLLAAIANLLAAALILGIKSMR